jgi:hypothetical protein
MMAARFYRCGRTTSGRLGRAPTLGRVRIGLNMIHDLMGQNKVSHNMGLRFDAYESGLQELSRKYLHA